MSAELVQVYGRWRELAIPPAAGDDTAAWSRFTAAAAETIGSDAVYDAPPDDDVDAETAAAMACRRAERLPLIVDPSGLRLGLVPFVFEHFGRIGSLESVAIRDDAVEFTAWAPARYADMLRTCRGVSPRIRTKRARLLDFGAGVRIVVASEAELLEVSATDAPLRPRTTFMVADTIGARFWAPRRGERSAGHEPGSFRALSDEGEKLVQANRREAAERMALRPGAVRLSFPGPVEVVR